MNRYVIGFLGLMLCTTCWSYEDDSELFSAFDLEEKSVSIVDPRVKYGDAEPLIVTEEAPVQPSYDGPTISSLVFVSDPHLSKYQNATDLQPVDLIDLSIPDEKYFRNQMTAYIGEPLTMEQLDTVQKEVTKFFVNHGKPLVRVVVPAEQDVTNGQVYVVILMGKLGKVRVQGEKYCNATYLKNQIKTNSGQEIATGQMASDISWLNNDPFRSIDLIYERGEDLGTTDVILDVKDRFPFQPYAGYDNTGYQSGGYSRWTVGFKAHTFVREDHQLNGQLVFANDFDKWWSASGNYYAPLPFRHTFKVFGSYVHSKPEGVPQEVLKNPKMRGKMWQIGPRYSIPFPRIHTYTHNITLGYDFKRTNNFTNVSGSFVFDEYFDISQFLFRYEADNEDRYGSTSWGTSFYYSPGDMTEYNTRKEFHKVNIHSKPNYFYGLINLDRITYLPRDWSWSIHSLFQWSDEGDLLPTEQMSLGGQYSVRGYKENEVIGSTALLGIMEFRTPSIDYVKRKGAGNLQFLVFTDFGCTWEADRNLFYDTQTLTSDRTKTLWSVGPGVRYNFKSYVSLRCDYGIQLKSVKGRFMGSDRSSMVHFGLFASY